MAKMMKKRPDERDLQAMRAAYEEAVHKGFMHREIPKAAGVLEWEASPGYVVLFRSSSRSRERQMYP